jgi:hypothetical protein
MKYLLILFTVFLVSCSGNPERTELETAQANVKRDLGLIKVQQNWESALDQCTPVKLPSCVLTAKSELAGRTALNTYIELRSSCLDDDNCDVCEMTRQVSNVLAIIGKIPSIDVSAACSSDSSVDDILKDLESMEIEDV